MITWNFVTFFVLLWSSAFTKLDCKTVGFFLKISKEIGKAWRKSLTCAKARRVWGVADLLFDCSRVLEYAKIRTVLQSITKLVRRKVLKFSHKIVLSKNVKKDLTSDLVEWGCFPSVSPFDKKSVAFLSYVSLNSGRPILSLQCWLVSTRALTELQEFFVAVLLTN